MTVDCADWLQPGAGSAHSSGMRAADGKINFPSSIHLHSSIPFESFFRRWIHSFLMMMFITDARAKSKESTFVQ